MKLHILPILAFGLGLVSCSDFIDVDSNSVQKTDEAVINSEASARYTMFGILEQLQKVADRYVVLGELRGDLLTTTDNSTQDLRDIAHHQVDSLNTWHDEADLYAIINNCNFLISRIDTSVVVTNSEGDRERVLRYEMAQACAIRDWSYLQLALTYGEVYYYTDPILNVGQQVNSSTLKLDELLPLLISDLSRWVPSSEKEVEEMPDYSTVGNYSSSLLFIPIRLLLGDLYLYSNDYEQAARLYYAHLVSNKLGLLNYRNGWSDNSYSRLSPSSWTSLFSNTSELQSLIQGTDDYVDGQQHLADIFSVKDDYLLAPSSAALSLWENQTYVYGASVTTLGDLRGEHGTYSYSTQTQGGSDVEVAAVTKYKNLTNTVILYRMSSVYLRLAEALNRLGKYNTAFALLKFGWNSGTMTTATYVPASEWKDAEGNVISYMDFGQSDLTRDAIFKDNVGIHSRGCGSNVNLYRSYCIESGRDSLLFVEDLLLDEMALETAYEGNRFSDLLRISRHRQSAALLQEKLGVADVNELYLPHEAQE